MKKDTRLFLRPDSMYGAKTGGNISLMSEIVKTIDQIKQTWFQVFSFDP